MGINVDRKSYEEEHGNVNNIRAIINFNIRIYLSRFAVYSSYE